MPPSLRTIKVLLVGTCVAALGACSRTQEVALIAPDDAPRLDASKIDPKSTSLKLADGTYARGDYAVAAQLYFRAAELDPTNPEIAVKLGFALFKTGGAAEAEKLFRGVLDHHSSHADARRGLAHSLVLQNRPGDAIPIYQKALEEPAGKADPRLYAGLGAALDSVGKHAEARAVYEAGLKIRPDDSGIKNNLAMSYAMAGQLEKAKAILEGAPADAAGAGKIKESLSFVNSLMASASAPAAKVAERSDNVEREPPPESRAVARKQDTAKPDGADEVVVVPASPAAKRPSKAAADLPQRFTANSEILSITTPRASHAEAARGSIADAGAARSDIGPAAATEGANEDPATEVVNLLGQSERGPRFVWQEAQKTE